MGVDVVTEMIEKPHVRERAAINGYWRVEEAGGGHVR